MTHPLSQLSAAEFRKARDIVAGLYAAPRSLFFRSIYLREPAKAELVPFLQAEHAGKLTGDTKRPPRLARVEYDVVDVGSLEYNHAVVDVGSGEVVEKEAVTRASQPYFTGPEFALFQDACVESPIFKEAMSEFSLPEGFSITIDPWPYGGSDDAEDFPRYMQGLVFARDSNSKNMDSNHYAYPIPIIPVMDAATKKIIRVDRLATGGSEDGLEPAPRGTSPRKLFQSSKPAEYVPELIDQPPRRDLKPLNVVQPEGASFKLNCTEGQIEWQKWRFRLGFTPREGAVLHDICYDNRPILYRLSYSELTVPYADPRPPFHRKQAFDLGDGGLGRTANNLQLGCDCLGSILYFDTLLAGTDGEPTPAKNVVCLHEQDNGILWKHTNFRTDRAVVARMRELVVQFIVTLANYEYVIAYKLDLAGGITIETRATGVMSVVAIDEGRTSAYGNVVSPGVLAQNHQHIFAVRIDPAVDSYAEGDTRVVVEDSVGCAMDPKTNPHGNLYEIQRRVVDAATWVDAEPRLNRSIRLESATRSNPVSGRPTGYRLVSPATQLLLSDEASTAARRAQYARHHTWVTGYRDGELWAAGEFTNQSRKETGGVADMVARGDWFTDEGATGTVGATTNGTANEDAHHEDRTGKKSSPVVWSVFGLTHNPRVEDWPVMPVEIHQMHLRPADFFASNPALDVPTERNKTSVAVPCCDGGLDWPRETPAPAVQEDPLSHLQGAAPDVDARAAGAAVAGDEKAGKAQREEGRLSRVLGGLFRSRGKA